jgi:hypothetical protein
MSVVEQISLRTASADFMFAPMKRCYERILTVSYHFEGKVVQIYLGSISPRFVVCIRVLLLVRILCMPIVV